MTLVTARLNRYALNSQPPRHHKPNSYKSNGTRSRIHPTALPADVYFETGLVERRRISRGCCLRGDPFLDTGARSASRGSKADGRPRLIGMAVVPRAAPCQQMKLGSVCQSRGAHGVANLRWRTSGLDHRWDCRYSFVSRQATTSLALHPRSNMTGIWRNREPQISLTFNRRSPLRYVITRWRDG
jgi:hypothetical protein